MAMRAPSLQPELDTGFFGHPRGLSTLFFTEMWERFSYYGMRALLILYMTAPLAAGGLGFDTAKAAPIYAMYVSSVYLLSLPGGWLADRVLGLRPAVFLGGVVIMAGHICLAVSSVPLCFLGSGRSVDHAVLSGPGADRQRNGAAQGKHQCAGREALRAGGRPAGCRVLAL